MTMDARKQRILEAIVAIYSTGGEPVGSGLLASHFDMALSSATLRNEMAALTKLGLLEQPHTSAGRVPSPKGYRYYLDHLLEAPAAIALSAADRENIDRLFADMDVEPEKLAQSAARALADYTGCAAVATTPQAEDLCIAHFEVVQVGRYSAAVLAVTSSGGVRTRVARIHTGLTREDADEMARLLNSSLTFVAPEDLTPSLTATPSPQYSPRPAMMRSSSGERGLPSSSFFPAPAMAITASRSVTAAEKSVLRLRVSQNCAANSSSPPIREYFLKMTSPSRVV